MNKPSMVWLAAAVFAVGLVLHGAIPQWASYHDFADRRALLGVPNAADVLSNLPFLVIGLWGWRRCSALHWRAFALAVACTALGSGLYHWAPDNTRLVFDRLPIAWACALLACIIAAERLEPRAVRAPVLAGALLLASLSVGAWWLSETRGHSDLRAYVFVQFVPMVLIVGALALRLPSLRPDALPASAWIATLALYGAAKAFELADHAVLQAGLPVSGHTLKHLCAAAAAWWLLRAAVSCGNPR